MQGKDKVWLMSLESECTWQEFLEANEDAIDGMTGEEAAEISAALDRGEAFMFGGGAAATFVLVKGMVTRRNLYGS